MLTHFGYVELKGCAAKATLCPALSLPRPLLRRQQLSRRERIDSLAGGNEDLLAAAPPYFSQAVVTADRRDATLAFGFG